MKPVLLILILLLMLWVPSAFTAVTSGVPVATGELELTLYGQDDLTLVRDRRQVPLKKGINRLRFRWIGQLIDPSSLQIRTAEGVRLKSVIFPPEVQGRAIFEVEADKAGEFTVDLVYLTAGLGWKARYQARLNAGQTALKLEGLIDINNRTKQPLSQARIRLLIGRIQLLDRIAELARQQPYGSNQQEMRPRQAVRKKAYAGRAMADMAEGAVALMSPEPAAVNARSGGEITLLEVEGVHGLPSETTVSLPWVTVDKVAVHFVYRYDEPRYGKQPVGLLSFDNIKAQGMGLTVLPEGPLLLTRSIANGTDAPTLTRLPYVPLEETARVRLDTTSQIRIEPRRMAVSTDDFFWKRDRVVGWAEQQAWEIQAFNHGTLPVTVEIRRELGQARWTIENNGAYGAYTKVDQDTIQYELNLPPASEKRFGYRLTLPRGKQAR